ncbi:SprT-like domain-containing protein [Spirosoma pollinicola]|uniref:SprT domain-containing protein n=1 Tax=Spirosoma pollinicola TaxID=2057025 RepID=A0A2K8Z5Y0_9BACT|nr:SprT-like domain-containing protein [Spirosoma pollinicola]AUD05260.1 sprT domain-containing protein [Spirosoma pollinicola]
MIDPFTTYFPPGATTYCRELWQRYNFRFKVTKPRQTRLGDFRAFPDKQTQITVNANLNPYAFLITYVHEVAHAAVNQHYKKRVQPHGKAWQGAFQQLMQPLLTETIFPVAILRPLQQYMANPAATTYASPALMMALRQMDADSTHTVGENKLLLSKVPEGHIFQFAKKTYVRGTLRRTRVVCKEVTTGRSYAILAHALVELVKTTNE